MTSKRLAHMAYACGAYFPLVSNSFASPSLFPPLCGRTRRWDTSALVGLAVYQPQPWSCDASSVTVVCVDAESVLGGLSTPSQGSSIVVAPRGEVGRGIAVATTRQGLSHRCLFAHHTVLLTLYECIVWRQRGALTARGHVPQTTS